MRKLILFTTVLLAPALTGCAVGFSSGVATPAEMYRSLDDRPRVIVLYNGSEADFVSLENDGYTTARGIRAGQSHSFPVSAYRRNGESRTLIMKGYRVVGKDTLYVGYRCRKVDFQGYGYDAGRSKPWVVDYLIPPGERSGESCY